jgi:TatA/E family protein of Tat protein translocase
MFGTLGGPELILIFIVGLVVFGPRKLPEIGKSLGKMIGEFRRASADFQRTIEDEVETEKLRKDVASAEYPSSPAPELTGSTAATAPLIREAEGSIPLTAPSESTPPMSNADSSGDTFSGGVEKSTSA